MSNALVVYSSLYGHTRRYAQWIAEDLDCPVRERREVSPEELKNCGALIFGGALYAGGVSGAEFLKKHQALLADKPLCLFTCGVADPEAPRNAESLRASALRALPEPLREKTALFFLRGGIDYGRLSLRHRAMMAALAAVLRRRPEDGRSEEDRAILETYGKAVDFTDRAGIAPLVSRVRADLGWSAPAFE